MSRAWIVPVFLVAFCLALLQLYPAWLFPEHAVPGAWVDPDMISNHWLYRWIPEQLLSGGSILHNDRYYAPVGDAPWLAGNGSDAVLYTPFSVLLPWPASILAWVGLALVLNGVAGAVLARTFGASGAGAVATAGFVTLSPYVLYEIGGARLAQAPLYWAGFFLAAWVVLLERAPEGWRPDRGTIARGALAGVLFGVTAFVYWYQGLWAAWAGAIAFAFRRRPSALVAFLPVAALCVVPPLAVFLAHWSEIPGVTGEAVAFPHPITEVSSLPLDFALRSGPGQFGHVMLPLALVGLAALRLVTAYVGAEGAGRARFRAAFASLTWAERAAAVSSVLFYSLALGPAVILPGIGATPIPGPYLLFYGLASTLRRFWWPYRHVAPLTLALAPLAARGFDAAVAAVRARAGEEAPRGLAAMLAAAVVLLLPIDLGARRGSLFATCSWWEAPAAYDEVADLEDGLLLELPITPAVAGNQQTLSYQWIHHKRLVNGHALWVDRVRPDAWDAWVDANPFLAAVRRVEAGEQVGPVSIDPVGIAALRNEDVRWIALNPEYFSDDLGPLYETHDAILRAAFGDPVVSTDDKVRVWDVRRYTGVTMVDAPPFRLPPRFRARKADTLVASPSHSLGWASLPLAFPPVEPKDAPPEVAVVGKKR